MATFTYRAVRIRQTKTSNWLVLFGAPARQIDSWAGAPQKNKKEPDTEETTGFQRDINDTRLESLHDFYRNERNIIQNPLLCATRDSSLPLVRFIPDDPHVQDSTIGSIEIQTESLESFSLLELLRKVQSDLERRVPALRAHKPSTHRLGRLKQQLQYAAENAPDKNIDTADDDISTEPEPDAAEVVFSDESHIFEFWEDVRARIMLLEEMGSNAAKYSDNFLGYTREAMIGFLQPVVIVDGQHRLRGAVDVARDLTSHEPFSKEIERRLAAGEDATEVDYEMQVRASRILPVSLLLTDDPAEHVFQFVVVNQKATPIDKALLGTIVSTTLSNDELSRVSDRLTKAGIKLEQSRSIAFLTRNSASPFYRLVERGLSSDNDGLMPWTVLGSLIRIFQDLKGGKLFGQKNDYSDKWRRDHLNNSPIIADWSEKSFKDAYSYWQSPDGPWRDVFVQFFTCIRSEFATTKDPEAPHYWGASRKSNLFNKISLTILAADFFRFLCQKDRTIESAEQIPALIDNWLRGVDTGYFNRPWPLSGVKKDSVGIRNRWAKTWADYREDPRQLPHTKVYREALKIE